MLTLFCYQVLGLFCLSLGQGPVSFARAWDEDEGVLGQQARGRLVLQLDVLAIVTAAMDGILFLVVGESSTLYFPN